MTEREGYQGYQGFKVSRFYSAFCPWGKVTKVTKVSRFQDFIQLFAPGGKVTKVSKFSSRFYLDFCSILWFGIFQPKHSLKSETKLFHICLDSSEQYTEGATQVP